MDEKHGTLDQVKLEPIEVGRLTRAAEHTLAQLRAHDARCGFNAHAVEVIARALQKERTKAQGAAPDDPATRDRQRRLADVYGAFIGHTLLTVNRQFDAFWVRSRAEIGVALIECGAGNPVFTPAERIRMELESGTERSLQAYLDTLARMVRDLEMAALHAAPVRLSLDRLREFHPELFSQQGWVEYQRRVLGGDTGRDTSAMQRRFADFLRRGQFNAAIVAGPQVIAAYCGEIDGVVLLGFERSLLEARGWTRGTRLLAINSYIAQGERAKDLAFGPQASGRFANVQPLIAELLSDDADRIEARLAHIGEDEWQRTEELAHRSLALGVRPRDGRPLFSLLPAGWDLRGA